MLLCAAMLAFVVVEVIPAGVRAGYVVWAEAPRWQPVEGTVLSADTTTEFDSMVVPDTFSEIVQMHQPIVRYQYEYEGRPYTSCRYSLLEMSSSDAEDARAIARRYPPGREVTVWVNPREPAQAVLEKGDGVVVAIFLAFGAITATILGCFMVLLAMGPRWARRRLLAQRASGEVWPVYLSPIVPGVLAGMLGFLALAAAYAFVILEGSFKFPEAVFPVAGAGATVLAIAWIVRSVLNARYVSGWRMRAECGAGEDEMLVEIRGRDGTGKAARLRLHLGVVVVHTGKWNRSETDLACVAPLEYEMRDGGPAGALLRATVRLPRAGPSAADRMERFFVVVKSAWGFTRCTFELCERSVNGLALPAGSAQARG